MGLDTTHDCWHGAYSAFSRWRNYVAKTAGYVIAKVTWDDVGYPADTVMLEWHRYEAKNYYGQWDTLPDDPLIILIVHSDCEGEIKPQHATILADRLEEILQDMEDEPANGHIAYHGGYRACTEQFIAGLRSAAVANEPVRFY